MSVYSTEQHRRETAVRSAQTAAGETPERAALDAAASIRPALASLERMEQPLVVLRPRVPSAPVVKNG